MNSLNRRLILLAVSSLALTASIGLIALANAHGTLKIDFNNLFKENEQHKLHIKEQALTIQQLGEEIRIKDDSITTLNSKITELVQETGLLRHKVRTLDQKVQQKLDEVAALSSKIKTIENSKSSDLKKINDLANEREELLKQMELMDKERTEEKDKIIAMQQEIAQKNKVVQQFEAQNEVQNELIEKIRTNPTPTPSVSNEPVYAAPPSNIAAPSKAEVNPSLEAQKEQIISARKQARMREIVTDTKIDYKSIKLKEEKGGNDLDRLRNEGWRYTVIEFDLQNPDQEAIFNEEFILQIFDIDNQRVVPFNESNPSFPDSNMGATGYAFTYKGQPMTIEYFNSQKKTGNNYEVRLYYAGKGFLLPISSGSTRIVEEGSVAAR